MSPLLPVRVFCAALLFSLQSHSVAAITCVANNATGRFEAPGGSAAAGDACSARAGENLPAFSDAKARAHNSGTRVYGGVFVTNANGQAPSYESSSLSEVQPGNSHVRQKSAPVASTWEILAADGSLQKTLSRWALFAGWEVHWVDVPEIGNPGYVKLPSEDFLAAVDYVFLKVKPASQAAGFDLQITAHPNRVLVISKENIK